MQNTAGKQEYSLGIMLRSGRHEKTLEHALDVLRHDFADYIDKIYLYGSCARGQEKYHSDVDLLVMVTQDTSPKMMRKMRSKVISDDLSLPEVELKFSTGPQFSDSYRFHENIKREGVLLWKKN